MYVDKNISRSKRYRNIIVFIYKNSVVIYILSHKNDAICIWYFHFRTTHKMTNTQIQLSKVKMKIIKIMKKKIFRINAKIK